MGTMEQAKYPSRFGKYILLDRLNSGGMAEVFRAKVTGVENFQRLIAIKCMLPNLVRDEQFTSMFIDEAKLASQLSHAGIVQIYELGRLQRRLYIAMELVNGRDLRHVIKMARRQKLQIPISFAAYVISKAAEALDFAHRKLGVDGEPLNLVHRDVSPQNILVSYDGEVKVVDFGIAKAEARATKTQAGVVKGKFAYMAPEQITGIELDRRADIFALGNVLFETVTGERLFGGGNDLSVLDKVRKARVPNLQKAIPGCPPELEQVLMKALAGNRDDRYAHASELAEALEPLLIEDRSIFGAKRAAQLMSSLFGDEISAVTERARHYAEVTEADCEPVRNPTPAPMRRSNTKPGTGSHVSRPRERIKTIDIVSDDAEKGEGGSGESGGRHRELAAAHTATPWQGAPAVTELVPEPAFEEKTVLSETPPPGILNMPKMEEQGSDWAIPTSQIFRVSTEADVTTSDSRSTNDPSAVSMSGESPAPSYAPAPSSASAPAARSLRGISTPRRTGRDLLPRLILGVLVIGSVVMGGAVVAALFVRPSASHGVAGNDAEGKGPGGGANGQSGSALAAGSDGAGGGGDHGGVAAKGADGRQRGGSAAAGAMGAEAHGRSDGSDGRDVGSHGQSAGATGDPARAARKNQRLGYLSVTIDGGTQARVYIDGRDVGMAPSLNRLKAGKHKVRVVDLSSGKPGRTKSGMVTIKQHHSRGRPYRVNISW